MEKNEVTLNDLAEITAILLHFAWDGREPKSLVPGKATLEDIHMGLKDLMLVLKYQRFDLESTRREKSYLQGLLGNR